MKLARHCETHLYTYAVALTQGDRITPDNLAGMRRKAIAHGHTDRDCQSVETNPYTFIKTGKLVA